ncbi:hypothetical protein GW916_11665 [bacterium]|nr:hypothetical protein [bacterium]
MLQTIDFKSNNDSKLALVLLHGYGANAEDLAPLVPILKQENDCWGYVPQAPISLPALAGFNGRAWFDLDMAMLEKRNATPDANLFDEAHIKRLQSCVDKHLVPFLENIAKDGTRICLGGFSQGSMLALDLLLRHRPSYLQTLVLFSGAWPYINQPKIAEGDTCPVFVSHGINDAVLPVKHSRKMVDELRKLDFQVRSNEFSGGHEIPPHIVDQAITFTSSTFFHS